MNPEPESDETPRRGDGPSVEKVSAWLAALVILLGAILFAKWWRDGSQKASCLLNIRNFQTAARSYAGIRPDEAGPMAPVDVTAVYRFMSSPPHYMVSLQCPSGGIYTAHGTYNAPPGTVFLRCSHRDHQPDPAKTIHW